MKLLIAIPHTGKIITELLPRMSDIFAHCISKGIQPVFTQVRSVPHDSSRNIIVQNLMGTDCEWLLSIDSDVLPPANIADMITDERPVCAAMVNACLSIDTDIPIEQRVRPVAIAARKEENKILYDYLPIQRGEILEVPSFGTGCFAVKREVFEKIGAPYFRFEYDDLGKMVVGEDLNFCYKVREHGYKTYMDGNFYCPHLKEIYI